MSVHYDALAINRNMALDLPFREGIGTLTHSVAKTHPQVRLINTPTWVALASGLGVIELNGTNEYLEADNADTLNLDFIGGDYSLGIWFNWATGGGDVQHLMGRYDVDGPAYSGWELYLYQPTGSLNLRHHHAATPAPTNPRSACDSYGWTQNVWQFIGFSRIGAAGQFYRGTLLGGLAPVATGHAPASGLVDPETCASDLTIGVRFTKGTEHLKAGIWRPRAWFDRALTEAEWQQVWEKEVEWFRS